MIFFSPVKPNPKYTHDEVQCYIFRASYFVGLKKRLRNQIQIKHEIDNKITQFMISTIMKLMVIIYFINETRGAF